MSAENPLTVSTFNDLVEKACDALEVWYEELELQRIGLEGEADELRMRAEAIEDQQRALRKRIDDIGKRYIIEHRNEPKVPDWPEIPYGVSLVEVPA